MKIEIDTSDNFALYCHYSGQSNAQDAYIDISNGTITASANYETGNSVPVEVFDGRTLRIGIPNQLTPKAVIQIIEENKAAFETIIAGHSESHSGEFPKGTLTEEADAAFDKLAEDLRQIDYEDYEHVEVWNIEHLCDQDIIPDDVDLSKLTEEDAPALAERIIKECQVNAGANVAEITIHGLESHLEELIEAAQTTKKGISI